MIAWLNHSLQEPLNVCCFYLTVLAAIANISGKTTPEPVGVVAHGCAYRYTLKHSRTGTHTLTFLHELGDDVDGLLLCDHSIESNQFVVL